jgi:hypothetical protein
MRSPVKEYLKSEPCTAPDSAVFSPGQVSFAKNHVSFWFCNTKSRRFYAVRETRPGQAYVGVFVQGANTGIGLLHGAHETKVCFAGSVLGFPHTGHLTRDRSDARDGSATCDRLVTRDR